MAKTQEELYGLYESHRDRMTESEIRLITARFHELDVLIESKSDVRFQNDVLGELEFVIESVIKDTK